MNNRKLSKFDKKYIKSHYIKGFEIDDNNKVIHVYYINGNSCSFPLTSQCLNNIKRIVSLQYEEWDDLIRRVYLFHPIKLLHINMTLKKQKYYLEHENEFLNFSIKNNLLSEKLSKADIHNLRVSKKLTHSYFNLSSVWRYKLRTMKKVHNIIICSKKRKTRKAK